MRWFPLVALALQASFSVRTDMVVLPVSVTDARGHSVAGLTAANFTVLDDGQPQEISLIRSGEVAVTLGLVVDHSQSMRSKLPLVASAAAAFARSGRTDDELFVVNFSDGPSLVQFAGKPFTNDQEELQRAVSAQLPAGMTAMYDAVTTALRHLPKGLAERKALIVVTDGGDNGSRSKYSQLRDLARASQAVIYGIGLTGASNQDENPDRLKSLCRDSGGAAYFPRTDAEVSAAFQEIGQDLRNQYTLGFVPRVRADRIYHPLAVKAVGPDGRALKARTRAGYTAVKPS